MSGCASKAPQEANEPSSYPPWVCGLSHNKDRWQCQREGKEPAPPAAQPADAGQAAPPADADQAVPAKTAQASPAVEPATAQASPAADPATAQAEPESPPPPTEPAVDSDAEPSAAADALPEEVNSLMALPPDYFAIQAGAFPNAEALQRHTLQYGIEPAYRVRLASNNRLFHVLILQVHDSQRAAEAALANLPQPLNEMDLWIRSVGSLQNAVRAGDALASDQRPP